MRCFVALGSNLGERRAQLEQAAQKIKVLPQASALRAGPVFETPALTPPNAPLSWRMPFLNSVVELEWSGGAQELLQALKQIESEMGRKPAEKWSPRLIDLDLLLAGDEIITREDCVVPHPELWNRSFVLGPLKHLHHPVLNRARHLHSQAPLWMGICNLTPDSFSDGGNLASPNHWLKRIEDFERNNIQAFDLGAESTRPGATPVSPNDEWQRLQPALETLCAHFAGRIFKPWISVDTRHAQVAAQALEHGADTINDVSGLTDPAMLDVLKSSACQYVLMHSLSVPADRNVVLPSEGDPVAAVLTWAETQLERLEKTGISFDRILFDPGIGFGKTPEQSLAMIRRIDEFIKLPVRILVGHSRKSFMDTWAKRPAEARDGFGIGVSLHLASKGVDVLRVHEPQLHANAHQALQELQHEHP